METREEEEELERERIEGRWWTDWLCGLKEKRDPAGQVSLFPQSKSCYYFAFALLLISFVKFTYFHRAAARTHSSEKDIRNPMSGYNILGRTRLSTRNHQPHNYGQLD